uniref:Uncharacterized protein n=1 Tax=Chromera velia CCMP2878 TaxID=1169474 RepID=A0A0G4FAV1_9ALVE|eukprot:Cvel_16058.t1-p1 / transcript=Cvel_16058.t1 / gene=Cvel_16058 / organism=Chromera_velia_CCMP2878 / gene_product=Probable helicase MAGATAMA 3, putative / transcript_product=Probable helicase MAGATAMA 3, putative / location=Cvel_scaffold1220:34628-39076(+) / protein_length=622 / sequence_SO=supercontig / SO=protein_coding / is_pseudo=false
MIFAHRRSGRDQRAVRAPRPPPRSSSGVSEVYEKVDTLLGYPEGVDVPELPPCSPPEEYLKSVILLFRQEVRAAVEAAFDFEDSKPGFMSRSMYQNQIEIRVSSAMLLENSFEVTKPHFHQQCALRKLADLQHHICVIGNRLFVVRLNKDKSALRFIEGGFLEELNLPCDPEEALGDSFPIQKVSAYSLGYFGSQRADAIGLVKLQANPHGQSTLLRSLADPTVRCEASLMPFLDTSGDAAAEAVPLNSTQKEAVRGLKYEIEAIQGPPRTGKSTTIYHTIKGQVPLTQVALVTSVQNKAIDSCAAKLQKTVDSVPFFVFGQAENIGETAKRWTLQAQMESEDGSLRTLNGRLGVAVMDEAGLTPEYKVPALLQLGIKTIVAIGDQQQLQPFSQRTVINEESSVGTGFFQRVVAALQAAGQPLPMLTRQYRMHPKIASVVSSSFYGGRLETDEDTALNRSLATMGEPAIEWLTYTGCKEEFSQRRSKQNSHEVMMVRDLLEKNKAAWRSKSKMVITFYRGQHFQLEKSLRDLVKQSRGGDAAEGELRVVTVDSSQGAEADVVILSCVRSNKKGKIGFLSNPHRLCVADSRAKERLLIVGDAETVCNKDEIFSRLREAAHVVE